MKFVLLRSNVFVRNARKIVKKQPQFAQNIKDTLDLHCIISSADCNISSRNCMSLFIYYLSRR